MMKIHSGSILSINHGLMGDMYRDRKNVFIDRMKWDVLHKDGLETDQFDDENARYIIIADPYHGCHLASARLLSSERPHILDTLFADLCEGEVPIGPGIYELTRFCITPRADARNRLRLRNHLFSALVEYALMHGITSYTGVTHISFLSQVLGIGWRCDMLGLPCRVNGSMLGAVQAHIEPETVPLMRRAGTYESLRMNGIDNFRIAA